MDFDKIVAGARMLIEGIGGDASSDGLVDTPERVAMMWKNFLVPVEISDGELLNRSFLAENYGDFVIVRNIRFSSFCEHHLLPFFGRVHVAYVPQGGTVVGISKLIRVVDKFSKRLQLQERLSQQILNAIAEGTANGGVLVIVCARHMCVAARGVLQPDSETITRATSGRFSTDNGLVAEAQQLIFGASE
ncbi:MAG: GTP cyclohydrolase I [Puniceicoccales bacterium]|nr:GTP cyclohydrolase I [Puniceicoccales bacterium]